MAKAKTIRGRRSGARGSRVKSAASAWQTFSRALDMLPDSSLEGTRDPFAEALWVYRCVDVKATSASGVPVRLSRGEAAGTRAVGAWKFLRLGPRAKRRSSAEKSALRAAEGEIVEAGPLAQVLARPNPEQTWSEFIYQTVGALDLAGRVHWVFDEMAGLAPRTMYVLPGNLSKPILAKEGLRERLDGWSAQGPDGVWRPVSLMESITFQRIHPLRPRDRVSPTGPARLAIVSDYNASKYNAAMFGNSAEPGGVLKTEAGYNAEADAQIRSTWAERHRGAAKARNLAVLWGGLQWQSIASTMADMQFGEGKRLTRTETCAAFGVPEVVAGFYTDANYAFAESGQEQFWWATELPLLGRIAEGINVHLIPRFGEPVEAWFDLEDNPVFARMRLKRLDAADKLWAKGVPLADCNDLLDLGIPERPWHDVGFLPSGLLPATDVAAGGGFSPVPEGPPAGEATDDLGQAGARSAEPGTRNKKLAAEERDARGRIWRAWARSWAPLASAFRQVLRSHFFEQERRARAALRSRENRERGTGNGEPARTKTIQVDALLIEIFNDPKAVAAFRARIFSALKDGRELGLRQALVESGLSGEALQQALTRLLANPGPVAALRGEAIILSTKIDAATREALKRSLEEGLGAGESFPALAARLDAQFGHRRATSMMVARNTIGQALSRSRHEGVLSTGMTHKLWLHTRAPEAAPRPGHVAAEETYAADPCPIADPFIVHGGSGPVSLMYPRDPSGPPGEIVNCQCLAIYKRFAGGEEASARAILAAYAGREFVGAKEMLDARQKAA